MKQFLLTLAIVLLASLPTQAAEVIEGDYDGDGIVGQGDVDLVLLNWGTANFPGIEEALLGGGPYDGQTSGNELDGVLIKWGDTVAVTASIPEPATLMLVGLAVACGLGRRQR